MLAELEGQGVPAVEQAVEVEHIPGGGQGSAPGGGGRGGSGVGTSGSGGANGQVIIAYYYPGVSVTMNGLPATICAGGSVNLSASASGGNGSYYLRVDGAVGGSNPGNVQSFNATVAGNYSVTVTDSDGNYASSSTGTLTVDAASTAPSSVSASVNPTCSGGGTVLTYSGGGGGPGATFYWYAGGCGSGSAIGTGNNLTVYPTTTTTYYGRWQDGSPCNDNTACASVTVTVDAVSTAPSSVSASVNPTCSGGATVPVV